MHKSKKKRSSQETGLAFRASYYCQAWSLNYEVINQVDSDSIRVFYSVDMS